MKKRFLVAAMAATMVSPLAAFADATVYGNVHLSIDSKDSDADGPSMNSNTSAIGVKGKEDLGGGMTALFKVEFQVAPDQRNNGSGTIDLDDANADNEISTKSSTALVDRDQWVGLKGGFGTIKFGTMSSNYKQMGGKIDPMYRTPLEGRRGGNMGTQSRLHGGAGENGGRMTNTMQYSSPKMSGVQAVFNYTFSGKADETIGLGLRYKTKQILAFADFLDVQAANGNNGITGGSTSEAAFKVGGSFKMDALTLGLQFESVEDAVGSDYIFVSANYRLNDNDNIAVTVGDVDMLDDIGYAVMYNHKMSKRTNVYVGYGDNANASDADDEQVTTVGIRHKF